MIYIVSYHPEKILKMDLACQIPIKKNQTKLKAMSNKLPQYAALARP